MNPFSLIGRAAERNFPSRQRGSVLISAAIALSLIVIALVGTELSYLFYMKREYQKTVDLAALAGAMQLDPKFPEEGCANAINFAQTNAKRNSPSVVIQTPECGHWMPGTATVANDLCFSGITDHFTPKQRSYNALRVRIRQEPPVLFGFLTQQRTICVQAVATSAIPTAVFSVGSKLIDTNSEATLMMLLKFAGADVKGACVVCYTGLATATISPSGLLEKLGLPVTANLTAGGLNALLAAEKITLGKLLNAVVAVAHENGTLDAMLDVAGLLKGAGIKVDDLAVQLGTDPAQNNGVRGLFAQIATTDTQAALLANVNALDLVTAAVGVATSSNAVNIGTDSLPLGLSLKTRIVEPPSIGIGSPRSNGNPGATAYNSQIRSYIQVNTDSSALLSGVLKTLGTTIDLPIAIDVVNAQGELTNIDCLATPPKATIEVRSPILSACIGQISPDALWSKTDVCKTDLNKMPLVKLLGATLLSGRVSIDALEQTESLTLVPGQTLSTRANELKIGDTIKKLIPQLLGAVGSQTAQSADRAPTVAIATAMAQSYFDRAKNDINKVKSLLTADGMTWNRPGLLGLISSPMPDEWESNVNALFGGCRKGLGYDAACAQSKLVDSLMTRNQGGLLTEVLSGLLKLVSGLLGLDDKGDGTPLLSTLLGPIINLLGPILDSVGALISKLLGTTLGLELGRTDVHLQSISCKTTKLVY